MNGRIAPIVIWDKNQQCVSEFNSSAIGMEINKLIDVRTNIADVFSEYNDAEYLVQMWTGTGFRFHILDKENHPILCKALVDRFAPY